MLTFDSLAIESREHKEIEDRSQFIISIIPKIEISEVRESRIGSFFARIFILKQSVISDSHTSNVPECDFKLRFDEDLYRQFRDLVPTLPQFTNKEVICQLTSDELNAQLLDTSIAQEA